MSFDFACLIYRPTISTSIAASFPLTDPVVNFVDNDKLIEQLSLVEAVETLSIAERVDLVERWSERVAFFKCNHGLDPKIAERTAWSEMVAQLSKGKTVHEIPDPMPLGATCPYCESRFLVDDPDAVRCWLCERLAWVTTPDSGIVRADFVGVKL